MKMVSCNSEDLLNFSDEKGEIHDSKSQIDKENIVKDEQEAFQTRQAHQRHMIKIHKAHTNCDQCDEDFTEIDAYEGYIFKEHGQAKMCPCP